MCNVDNSQRSFSNCFGAAPKRIQTWLGNSAKVCFYLENTARIPLFRSRRATILTAESVNTVRATPGLC